MKIIFPAVMVLLMAGCEQRGPLAFTEENIIDLTYAYDSTTIYWPTEKGFVFEKGAEGMTPGGYFYTANRFWTPEHGGTHIDAPIHFYEGRWRMDEIPPDRLIGAGIIIDVSKQCEEDRDYQIRKSDCEEWEKSNGRIPEGAIVLFRTGFGKYWPDRVKYMGTNERGAGAVAKLHFPGIHADAAVWLADERKVKMVGLDTPSIDHGQSTRFETHVALYERNVPGLENVANLDRLPGKGFTLIALPMKIKGGSGGPVRIVAVMDAR